jgi:hypothetical protein
MSLLTNEQIETITSISLNQSTSKDLYDELCEWNEKQRAQQFEPDWSKAPRSAEVAILKSYWVGEGTYALGQTVAEYKRPAPVVTPHPHAEMIMKYAEVAQRRVDPWVEFEIYSEFFGNWIALEVPTFFDSMLKYRYIGDDK